MRPLCLALLVILPAASAATGYTKTRYPIVLVHGLFGFDSIGKLEYFNGIRTALDAEGATTYPTSVSAANSTELRGQQLLAQVQQILASSGAAKVNLIGHSHGAPTARYVASVRPDLVASVTSVGGVNKGSPVADVLIGAAPDASYVLADALTGVLLQLTGSATMPQNVHAALKSISTQGMAEFNLQHPAGVPTSDCGEGAHLVNGVRYFSWSGSTPWTNIFSPTDNFLAVTSQVFQGAPNDGLVSTCSSHLGQVIGDHYRLNHLDEINQLRSGSIFDGSDNPVELYRQQAHRLQQLGL